MEAEGDVGSSAAPADPDWRSQVKPGTREFIVDKIIKILGRLLPSDYNALKEITLKFEERVYANATSQDDYVQRISRKMISLEPNRSTTGTTNPSMSNSAIGSQTTADSDALLAMQPQDSTQGQLLVVPLVNQSPASQSILHQKFQNTTHPALQGSHGLPIAGFTGSSIPHAGQTSNMQPMSSPDFYGDVQRQTEGRQQQQPKQNQQLSLDSVHQFQQKAVNQNLQHSSILQPRLQQQSLLHQQQLQTSQKRLMQVSSSFQSGQSTIQQTRPGSMQTIKKCSFLQNQQKSQQSEQFLLEKNQQSVSRQQLQQISSHQQQPTPMTQYSLLQLSQQQQQLTTGKQSNISNMQQIQLPFQQNDVPDRQKQRLQMQQNNHLSMQQRQQMPNQLAISLHQQPQLGRQSNIIGVQQQEQQSLKQQSLESLPNVSNVQLNQHQMQALQQPTTATHQQQYPSHPGKQLMMQQNSNSVYRDVEQRPHSSGTLLQSQNANEHQKHCIQAQRGFTEDSSSTSMEVLPLNASLDGLQEEVYQKVKSMKEMYIPELTALHRKAVQKLQQLQIDSSIPPEQRENLPLMSLKNNFEKAIAFLQRPKHELHSSLQDKLPDFEKKINRLISIGRGKKVDLKPQGQQQFQYLGRQSPSITPQPPPQDSELVHLGNYMDTAQDIHMQASATSTQLSASCMQNGPNKKIGSLLQTSFGLDSVQDNSDYPMQREENVSVQREGVRTLQNTPSSSQQTKFTPSHNSMNMLHSNMSITQPISNVPQNHLKQQDERQKLMQAQQMKQQSQQCLIQQQQLLQQQQKQKLRQQQPLLQLAQQEQQKMSQLSIFKATHLHQKNEFTELKVRLESDIMSGICQPHNLASQYHNSYQQQLNPGPNLPTSSPQNFQGTSPQISQSPSPQINRQSLLPAFKKPGTPLQSANSPPHVLSPSAPVDCEKQLYCTSTLSNVVYGAHQQTVGPFQSQPLIFGTPGISASPLLAEFTSPDGEMSTVQTSQPSASQRPVDRLVKAMESISSKALRSSVIDIGSVVSLIDGTAGSEPGNGCKSAVGQDLAAMSKCGLKDSSKKSIQRCIDAIPLTHVPSTGSIPHDSSEFYRPSAYELESTETSTVKRQKVEINQALLEETEEINRQLFDTVVSICDRNVDSTVVAGDGALVEFSFTSVTLHSDLKSHFGDMTPIMPLRLLVPSNYPQCSPVILDKLPDDGLTAEPSLGFEDLSIKAKSAFSATLRGLPQPMSLKKMAKTWDTCARRVIREYAEQYGGGTFSTKYGSWENYVGV